MNSQNILANLDQLTASPTWIEDQLIDDAGTGSLTNALNEVIASFVDPLTADQVIRLVQLASAREFVRSYPGIYDDNDLKTLVWFGRERQALAYARLRDTPEDQFNGLLAVFQVQVEQNQPSDELIGEMRSLVKQITSQVLRVFALSGLGVALTLAGDGQADAIFTQAVALADDLGNPLQQEAAYQALAIALAQGGRFEQAGELARRLTNELDRVMALSELAAALAQAGDDRAGQVLGETRRLVNGLHGELSKVSGMSALAVALAQAGDDQASEMLTQAGQLISHPMDRAFETFSNMMRHMGAVLTSLGDDRADEALTEAERAAQNIQSDEKRAAAQSALASVRTQGDRPSRHLSMGIRGVVGVLKGIMRRPHNPPTWDDQAAAERDLTVALVRTGHYVAAQQVADQISRVNMRVAALSTLVAELAQAGHYDAASKIAHDLKSPWMQATALSSIAVAMAQAGDDQAAATFQAANAAARRRPHEYYQSQARQALVQALIHTGHLSAAREVTGQFQEDKFGTRTTALQMLENATSPVAETTSLTEMLEAAYRVPDELRAHALAETAAALAQAGDDRADALLDEVNELLNDIQEPDERDLIEFVLVGALAHRGRFEAARAMVDHISDVSTRRDARQELVERLAEAHQFAAALATSEQRPTDVFVETMAKWAVYFEAFQPGLSGPALREMLRIVGWGRLDWHDIYLQISAEID